MQKKSIPTIISLAIVAISSLILVFTNSSLSVVTDAKNGSVVKTSEGWRVTVGQAGGYARVSYQIPEQQGKVFTSFYIKTTAVFEPGFTITKGFRVLNTDNYGTTVKGTFYGANNINEFRCGLYFWESDQLMRLRCKHENVDYIELWKSSAPLPVGTHTFEFWGDVGKSAPWGLKIDGVLVASGVQNLCIPNMVKSECVVTRVRVGMDGAAMISPPQTLIIKSFSISESYPGDVINAPTYTPTPSATVFPPFTSTRTATVTPTVYPTNTITSTVSPTPSPTLVCYPVQVGGQLIGEFCP